MDGAIVLIHNNMNPERYDWLSDYNDLILVCGVPETCEKVAHLGTPIYVPLSIDTNFVSEFRTEKTKKIAFAGRKSKARYQTATLPDGIDYLYGMSRNRLLAEMAKYEQIYAVGRTAIEARALGCEILPYDNRYPNPDIWQVVDCRDAAAILQREIDRIDGK